MDGLKLSIFIVIAAASVTIFAQTFDCTSPTGLQGYCINLIDCPPLVRLIKMVPLYQKDVVYLRESQCGKNPNQEPKVCCVPDYF